MTHSPDPPDAGPNPSTPSSKPWRFRLFVLTLSHVVGTVGYLSVAAMAPVITQDLTISTGQFGFLMSSFFAAQLVMALPAGALTDRLGVGWSLTLSMGLLAAGTSAFAAIPTYQTGLVSMFVLGTGYSLVNPATARGVLRWFSEGRRGTAMGVKQLGVPLGGLLAAGLGALVVLVPWQTLLWWITVVAVLTALICMSIANPPDFSRKNSALQDIRTVLANRSLGVLNGAIITFNVGQTCLFTYLTLFLREAALASQPVAALCLACAQGAGAAGRVGFSFLSDVVFHGRRKIVIVPLLIGAVASLIAASFVEPGWTTWALVGVSVALGLTVATYAAIILTLTVETVDPDLSGSAIGYGAVAWSIGGTIGPPIFGYVYDLTGQFSYSWLAVATIVAIGVLWFALLFKERRTPSPVTATA